MFLWIFEKMLPLLGYSISAFTFWGGLSGLAIITLTMKKRNKLSTLKYLPLKYTLFYSSVALVFGSSFFFSVYAISLGDIAIVYKIISYSLFFPIIYSIIFYKEKVTMKKLIAFILTIISIALFI